MAGDSSSKTGTTLHLLLENVDDQRAWEAFVDRYGPKVYGWCRKWKLQRADAEDVTQAVLAKLSQCLRTFRYDPSKGTFRGWLKTLTQHAWSDYVRGRNRAGNAAGDAASQSPLESLEAREDLTKELEAAFDLELLEEAKAQVRRRVTPQTWDAFRLLAVEDRPGAEVAAALGMKVSAVYVAKNRVQKMLQQMIRALEGQ